VNGGFEWNRTETANELAAVRCCGTDTPERVDVLDRVEDKSTWEEDFRRYSATSWERNS